MRPRAAYAVSNYEAERILLAMADDDFCPVILRQGTVYGWSPRMRYDLVVNTFVRDAIAKGVLTVHCGGEMWRPLVDVTDLCPRLRRVRRSAGREGAAGSIFNVVGKNYRILELAHWVREALRARQARSRSRSTTRRTRPARTASAASASRPSSA